MELHACLQLLLAFCLIHYWNAFFFWAREWLGCWEGGTELNACYWSAHLRLDLDSVKTHVDRDSIFYLFDLWLDAWFLNPALYTFLLFLALFLLVFIFFAYCSLYCFFFVFLLSMREQTIFNFTDEHLKDVISNFYFVGGQIGSFLDTIKTVNIYLLACSLRCLLLTWSLLLF